MLFCVGRRMGIMLRPRTVVIRRFLFLTLLAFVAPAHAADRIALVVGNGNYQHTSRLKNPANDAEDLAAALRKIGFDVVEGRDLDRRGMEERLRLFAHKLDSAKIALFFYAGHGLQVSGKNYLLPVDAKLENPRDLAFETIELGQVLAQMDAANAANIVILDACRDNPLARTLLGAFGPTRSGAVGRGLARDIISGDGTIIVYSTQPDNVALDGDGRNSPYTAALLKHLTTPGLEVGTLMRRVRLDVVASTERRQIPWDSNSLLSEVVLVPAAPGATQVATIGTGPLPAPAVAEPIAAKTNDRPSLVRSSTPCVERSTAAGVDRYCASSVLSSQGENAYGVQNLFGNANAAWVEGVPGFGISEWISVEFDAPRDVASITIQNGYQKSADIFAKNTRVRRLRAVFSEGEILGLPLEDKMGPQTIPLGRPIRARWVQLFIEDVYPGTRYTDTAISKLSITSERAR
jgi:Caspase domain